MTRKLTITVSEAVYNGLHRTVAPEDMGAAYREMAADEERSKEALEWSESLIVDSSNAEPNALWPVQNATRKRRFRTRAVIVESSSSQIHQSRSSPKACTVAGG